MLDGPRRYTDLQAALRGIASNLLGQRLRSLVDAGVIAHADDGSYALTPWGEGLRDVLYAIGRWGTPLMATPPGDDRFEARWLRHLIAIHFGHVDRRRVDGIIEVRAGGEPITIVVTAGRVVAVVGEVGHRPDAVVAGPPDGVGAVLLGVLPPTAAEDRGVDIDGDVDLVVALGAGRQL